MVAIRPQKGLPLDCSPIIPAKKKSQYFGEESRITVYVVIGPHTVSESKDVLGAAIIGPTAGTEPGFVISDIAGACTTNLPTSTS